MIFMLPNSIVGTFKKMQKMEIILMCKAMMATLPTSKVPEVFILAFVVWLYWFAMYVYIIAEDFYKKNHNSVSFSPSSFPVIRKKSP